MLRSCHRRRRLVVLHPPALRIPIRNAGTQESPAFLHSLLILVFRFLHDPQINLAIQLILLEHGFAAADQLQNRQE